MIDLIPIKMDWKEKERVKEYHQRPDVKARKKWRYNRNALKNEEAWDSMTEDERQETFMSLTRKIMKDLRREE